jgi:phenylacetate-CoA ligase
MDNMEVRIEVTSEAFSDRVSEIEGLAKRLAHAVESTTGIRVKISLVEPQTIQRSEGKAQRVLDLRNLGS